MYIALGTVMFQEGTARNSVLLIDPDGLVLAAARLNEECLLTAEIEITEPGFGRQGRFEYSRVLTALH
jgi:hypothetical protein